MLKTKKAKLGWSMLAIVVIFIGYCNRTCYPSLPLYKIEFNFCDNIDICCGCTTGKWFIQENIPRVVVRPEYRALGDINFNLSFSQDEKTYECKSCEFEVTPNGVGILKKWNEQEVKKMNLRPGKVFVVVEIKRNFGGLWNEEKKISTETFLSESGE